MSNGHYQSRHFHSRPQGSQSYGDSRHLPSTAPSFNNAPVQTPRPLRPEPSWTSVTSTYTGYDGEDAEEWPTPEAYISPRWRREQEIKQQNEAMLAGDYDMEEPENPPQSRARTPSARSVSTYDGSDDGEETETEGGDFDDGASSISRLSFRYRTPSVEPTNYYARSATAPPAPPPTRARGPVPGTSVSVSAASTSSSELMEEGRPRRANKPSLRQREHDEYIARTSPKKKQYAQYSLSAGGPSRRF